MRKKIQNTPYSVAFSGDDVVNLGNLGDFGSSMSDAFAILFKFRSLYAGSQNYIIGGAKSNTYLYIMASPGGTGGGTGKLGIALRDESSGEIWVNTEDAYNDGEWHTVAVVKDATNTATGTKFVIDGVEVNTYNRRSTDFADPADFTRNVAVGAHEGLSPSIFLSRSNVTDVHFYKREVTTQEAYDWHFNGILPSGEFKGFEFREGGGEITTSNDGLTIAEINDYRIWSHSSPSTNLRDKDILANYPSQGVARCHDYGNDAELGAANGGNSNGAVWDYLLALDGQRARQAGTISTVKMTVPDVSQFNYFYITHWRINSAGTYDLIDISDDVMASLEDGVIGTHTFATPWTDVRLGDHFGFRMSQAVTGPSIRYATGLGFNYRTTYSSGSAMPDEGANWSALGTYTNEISFPMELYIEAPQLVYIGDSIMAGHTESGSLIESYGAFEPTKDLPYLVTKLLSGDGTLGTYQNMGIGGQTLEEIDARFIADAVDLNPWGIVINGMVNDIDDARSSVDILANVASIITKAAGKHLFFMLALPWQASSTAEAQQIDYLNEEIKALLDAEENMYYIDPTAFISNFRTGGDAGNAWDFPLYYTASDTIHPNFEGYKLIADIIYRKIKSVIQ